jgi:RNA polymerase sigma factor for flagellar operon FliA
MGPHDDRIDRYAHLFDGDRELTALWIAGCLDDDAEARAELASTYVPLVRYVVSRMNITLPASLERNDLVGFGTLGLIDAIGRFDLDRGLSFKTYAVTRIRGAILDELRALDWVPRMVRSRMHAIDEATEHFEQEHGGEPDVDDLATATGLAREEIRSTLTAYQSGYLASLEERSSAEDDDGRGLQLVDATAELPDEVYDHDESQRLLRTQIRGLPLRERAIIALYYYEEFTFGEIGRVLGVSESRACQLHGRAVRALREAI